MLVEYANGTTIGTCSIHCAAVDLAQSFGKEIKALKVADFRSGRLIDAEKAVWVVGAGIPGVMAAKSRVAFADAVRRRGLPQGQWREDRRLRRRDHLDLLLHVARHAGDPFPPSCASTEPRSNGCLRGSLTTLTAVTKYPVSPKQLVGMPMCCSYVSATLSPIESLICRATASLRTVKGNFSATVPGIETSAISPSQVLQSHPFFESFCT